MSARDQRDGSPTRDGETEDMLPAREVRFPPSVHHTHRHPLGVSPPPLLAAVGAVTFVIALILLVLGSWVAGIVFLCISGAACCLLVVAIRREPETQTSRVAVTAAERAGGYARLTSVALRAAARSGLELVRLWGRRRRLRFELHRQLAPLGEAVHSGDQGRALELKAQADALDRSLTEADRRSAATIAAFRDRIERERAIRPHVRPRRSALARSSAGAPRRRTG